MSETGDLFGGDWTQQKLRMLEKYLRAYMKIMKDRPFSTGYIDAFAGAGYLREKRKFNSQGSLQFPSIQEKERRFLQGSARVALEVTPSFDGFVFVEKNEGAFLQLRRLKEDYPGQNIQFICQDANTWLRQTLEARIWAKRRAVVFLDPFGMQVSWKTIEGIAQTQAIDLWILFPHAIGANRLLARNGNRISEAHRKRLNSVFGTSAWEDRFYKNAETLFGDEQPKKVVNLKGIGDFYMERLKEEFAKVAPNPLELRNSKNNPMYLLFFAASNPRAADTAVKIAQHILGSES
jgi:three-Cys-motif partner protein